MCDQLLSCSGAAQERQTGVVLRPTVCVQPEEDGLPSSPTRTVSDTDRFFDAMERSMSGPASTVGEAETCSAVAAWLPCKRRRTAGCRLSAPASWV